MNLLNRGFFKYKNNQLKISKSKNSITIKNDSNKHGFVIFNKIFKFKKGNYYVKYSGLINYGDSASIVITDMRKRILADFSINSNGLFDSTRPKFGLLSLRIAPFSSITIDEIDISYNNNESYLDDIMQKFDSDFLIVTPSYPTPENKYFGGFVHSRLKAYKEAGIKFDVICAHDYPNAFYYNFEGVDVLRAPFKVLRDLLQRKKYKKIMLHFFDTKYATILDACDLSETNLYFWVHGPETLYRDWPLFTTPYFSEYSKPTQENIEFFNSSDEVINRYNNMENVKWIFVSNWIKARSEELIGISFKNFEIIPNVIDDVNFNYVKKDPKQRKNIFLLRRYDNINKYGVDISVKAILELSRRPFFKDLNINIYGAGDYYDQLLGPLMQYKNIKLFRKFLSHEEISAIHKENGIALFPTRYDAQGVSMCEAASSGLVVVSSNNDAIKEFLVDEKFLLCDTEKYVQYADAIEKLYYDIELFNKLSYSTHLKIKEKCGVDVTINKELKLFDEKTKKLSIKKIKPSDEAILTIIIPSYKVEKYLKHGVETLLNCDNSKYLEIIIVIDGSPDNSLLIAEDLSKKYNVEHGRKIIRVINKENGGHGSTINVGIEQATGKYVRIMDGDDWVKSSELSKLIDKLIIDDSDIVITNYSEDRADINALINKKIYFNLIEGIEYNFDDLCYQNYGFSEWGPILATANFKTEMLKKTNFKLQEKCFYVDMEFNCYSVINATTIKYYNFDIYRYFIGRIDQSVSATSFARNYKQHEKIIFSILTIINDLHLSELKKQYIENKLLIPMIKSHYMILIEYLKSSKEFVSFDDKIKGTKYYKNRLIESKLIKITRSTKGSSIKFIKLLKKINNILKRGK